MPDDTTTKTEPILWATCPACSTRYGRLPSTRAECPMCGQAEDGNARPEPSPLAQGVDALFEKYGPAAVLNALASRLREEAAVIAGSEGGEALLAAVGASDPGAPWVELASGLERLAEEFVVNTTPEKDPVGPLTCIHCESGLCPACQAESDEDPGDRKEG